MLYTVCVCVRASRVRVKQDLFVIAGALTGHMVQLGVFILLLFIPPTASV